MAELELITGRTGEQHVLAIDDAEIYRTLLGNGDFILSTGHKFEATPRSANRILVYDGTAVIQGRQMKIRSGSQELETEGGVVGFRREDAIVLEYSKSGDIETAQLKVIKGANDSSAYKPPTLIQGNIDAGQTRQVRIWGVRYEGYDFKGLIDYRTILDTTPIQTALDTATSGLRNIQAIITSYQSQIDGDMSSYQSQIETRLEAIRGVVNVAPLTTIFGRNVGYTGDANIEVEKTFADMQREQITLTPPPSAGSTIYVDYTKQRVTYSSTFTQGVEGLDGDVSYDGDKTIAINEASGTVLVQYTASAIELPSAGYVYSATDIFDVYVNGLKALPDTYEVRNGNNTVIIVADWGEDYSVSYDTIEVKVWRPE